MSPATAPTAPIDVRTRTRVERLVRREAPALLAYFERRVPLADAPDLLGETLLVIWRRADSLPDEDQAARMWFFGIARHILATGRRGNVRRQALVDRLRAEAQTAPPAAPSPDIELASALAVLSPSDLEIVRLVHWDGFNLAEVAKLLGRPAGTIRSRYSRARASLRSALG